MKFITPVCITAALLLTSVGASADGINIKPGSYKSDIMMEMQMPGMPPEMSAMGLNKPMTMSNTQCITPEEANLSEEEMVEQMSGGGQCKIADLKRTSSAMSFKFQCADGDMGNVEGSSDIKFTPNSYKMIMDMTGTIEGMPMTYKLTGDAKRVGDC